MTKKKIYMSALETHDSKTEDCLVRQIEMRVDNIVPSVGYSIQFWRDVKLYGVDEAILYLIPHTTEKELTELTNFWLELKEKHFAQ